MMKKSQLLAGMLFTAIVLAMAAGWSCSGEKDAAFSGDGDFLPGFARYLEDFPLLAEGGGTIVADGDAWLAIGIGASVRTGREQPEYLLWKIADHNALKGLAEALEGAVYSAGDSADVDIANTAGGAAGMARESSFMLREIGGTVSGSREVGRWKSGAGQIFHVMRALFSPGHPLAMVRNEFPVRDAEIDQPWRDEFLSRAFLRHGGVDIAVVDGGGVYLLVVGTAPVKDVSPSARINASRMADIRARANLLAFYDGVRIQASMEAATVRETVYSADAEPRERVEEKLQSRSSAQIKGVAGRMKSVGGWLSETGDIVARAYVVDVEEL